MWHISQCSFGNIEDKKDDNEEDLELQVKTKDDDASPQILLVDDDAFNIFALKNMFVSQHQQTEQSLSGVEAIEIIKARLD